MKTRNIGFVISIVILFVSMTGMIVGVVKMSQSVEELAVESVKGKAEAILASANVNDKMNVTVPILYYDQKMDTCVNMYSAATRAAASWRQFEWSECGYQNFALEKNIVDGELNSEYLPVATGGEAVVNRGIVDGFSRWFSQVDGKSKSYGSTLGLTYDASTASFKYESGDFYPLDKLTMSATEGEWVPHDEDVNDDGHNHLFTLNLGVPIQVLANGSERFEITADDDTWVFVDDKLVIDMGGLHDATKASFEIRADGEVYAEIGGENAGYVGVTLVERESAVIRIFHADRDSGTGSVFRIGFINMVPNITDATLAKSSGGSGVEIAYDPSNPSYVAPLGESLTVKPDKTRALKTAVVVQGIVIGVLAIVVVIGASVGIRIWQQKHSS